MSTRVVIVTARSGARAGREKHLQQPRSIPFLARALAVVASALSARAQTAFVNWESAHVHPLELTPDGTRLLAVNTADDRLEVFDLASGVPLHAFDVPVGLDPVSVRAFSNTQAWVVNHVSDSVSVVDLAARNVVATLRTDDEPADVVFAGEPSRAYVSCSQANTLLVFDPARRDAAPERLVVDGEGPRALATSRDRKHVYAAIFESGNDSTVLAGGALFNFDFPPGVVNHRATPYSGRNPPPNSKAAGGFEPALSEKLPAPPKVGLIVKRNGAGEWRDDFAGDWTHLVSGANAAMSGRPVGWELADNDIAIVDTQTRSIGYARHLMNTCMALAVHPVSGEVVLVGTDATNERRFEPVLRGRFLRVELARVNAAGATLGLVDLNPHLPREGGSYSRGTVAASERAKSIGDPRALAWNAAGTRGYVAGMGSNNVVVVDAAGARVADVAPIEVGEGPTGIVFDAAREQLYVLCKFEGALSVVSAAKNVETRRVRFFDPTPAVIRAGRKHLYDTRANSGLGQIACASCHVDARYDHLAWDLGDPSGSLASVAGNNLAAGNAALTTSAVPGRGEFQPFHPMKGPMLTQSLIDIIGLEPLHWRGDRSGLEAFAGAFMTLQGDDAQPSAAELQELEDFLATLTYPPNPFRAFDNSLPRALPLPGHFTTGRFGPAGQPLPAGDARAGLERFRTGKLDNLKVDCVTCHTLPTGMGTDSKLVDHVYEPIATGPRGEHHLMLVSQDGSSNVSMKVPQLRNLYERVGFNLTQPRNHFGFGFAHDGSIDSIERFVNESSFSLASDQETADMVAFLLAFSGSDLPAGSAKNEGEPPGPASKDTHAAVGWQVTLDGSAAPARRALVADMLRLADAGRVGVVVKGVQARLARGWVYSGARRFQSDRAKEACSVDELAQSAAAGSELTYTVVPAASALRIGVDRDADGAFDRDELDAGSDPADARSVLDRSGSDRDDAARAPR